MNDNILSEEYSKRMLEITDNDFIKYSKFICVKKMRLQVSGCCHRILDCILYFSNQNYIKFKNFICQDLTMRDIKNWTGMSLQSVQNSIETLIDKNVIIRKEISHNKFIYSINHHEWDNNGDIDFDTYQQEIKMKRNGGSKKWSDLSKKKRSGNINEWESPDFLLYAKEKVVEALAGKDTRITREKFAKGMISCGAIVDAISHLDELTGGFRPVLLIAYIDWMVANKVESIFNASSKRVNKTAFFSSVTFSNITHVKEFIDSFGINEKTSVYEIEHLFNGGEDNVGSEKTYKEVKEANLKDMNKTYDVGFKSLLSEYGVILSANYLLKIKHKNDIEIESAIQKVFSSSSDTAVTKIASSTYDRSPYPQAMPFCDWEDEFHNEIANRDIKVKKVLVNSEISSYDFLMGD